MDLTGRKLGKYDVIKRLGQGGMAEVYQAFQPGVERHVAIKVMHPHLAATPDFVDRFKREAKAVGRLQHPHIMRVIDFEVQDNLYYMVMEFMQGQTLADYLALRRILPFDEAIALISQLLSALDYAHQQEMTHRDIKPANVMFMDEHYTHAVLTDFGLAHLLDDTNLTKTGTTLGTPTYMAPEMVKGEPCDHRADLYGIGVILYEMVTGRAPYIGDTPYSVMLKQANDPLPWPRQINPEISAALEQVIVKSLAKKPAERYQSAAEFLIALQNLGAELPTFALTRPNLAAETTQISSRPMTNWWSFIAAAGGILLFALALAGGLMLWNDIISPPPIATVVQVVAATATPETIAPVALITPTITPLPIETVAVITPTATLTPTVIATLAPVGRFQFLADGFRVKFQQLRPLPPELQYVLWVQGAAGAPRFLANLPPASSQLNFNDESEDLLRNYDTVLVSIEAVDHGGGQLSGQVVISGTVSSESLTVTHDLLFTETQRGLLLNAYQQALIAQNHTGFLQDELSAEAFAEARRHAEHIVNITVGKNNPVYGDLNGDGQAQNPGDNVGLEVYLTEAQAQIQQLLAQPNVSASLRFQAEQALSTTTHALMLAQQIQETALQIFATDTPAEAKPFADRLTVLTAAILEGFDEDGNGVIDPMRHEGGILTAITEARHLAEVDLYATDSQVALPLQHDAGAWTLQFVATSTLINKFSLTVERVPYPAVGQRYELWLQAEGNLLALGVVTVTANEIHWQGEASENLLAADNQIWLTLETTAPPTRPGSVAFYGALPAEFLAPMHKIIFNRGDGVGLLPQALTQSLIALKHTGFMQDSIQATDLPLLLKHTEHVINILDGETGAHYGDLDGSGLAENPGDGVGVRLYMEQAQQELQQALTALPPDDPRRVQAMQVSQALSHTHELGQQAIELALKVFASDTLNEAKPFADTLQQLVYQMQHDEDSNGYRVVTTLQDTGAILTAYRNSLQLATLPLIMTNVPAPPDLPLKTVTITPTVILQ